MGALLVEDCLKLSIGALTRGDRGRGRIFLRGVPIEFEVRTTFPHGVMYPIRFVRLKFNGRTQDICPPSALVGQIQRVEEGRISGSS
jgi:hypothetical protein